LACIYKRARIWRRHGLYRVGRAANGRLKAHTRVVRSGPPNRTGLTKAGLGPIDENNMRIGHCADAIPAACWWLEEIEAFCDSLGDVARRMIQLKVQLKF